MTNKELADHLEAVAGMVEWDYPIDYSGDLYEAAKRLRRENLVDKEKLLKKIMDKIGIPMVDSKDGESEYMNWFNMMLTSMATDNLIKNAMQYLMDILFMIAKEPCVGEGDTNAAD